MEAFEYLLINDEELLYLTTIEYYTETACNTPQLITLNIFNKTTQKWEKKLQIYEKFQNFHGCELVMRTAYHINYAKGWMGLKKSANSFEVIGIIPKLFEDIGRYFNYKPGYEIEMLKDQNDFHCTKVFESPKIDWNLTLPNVCFGVTRIEAQANRDFKSSHFTGTFLDIFEVVLVTPGHVYSSYEKLLLPFDKMTWILLVFTFFTAFLTIFVIYFLPEPIHRLFYGPNVKSPALNVISTFFGIPQLKDPRLHFSRFILMMFILFCLIFRTCYQSKMFEFMTTSPRRPPPNSMKEMAQKGYKLLARDHNVMYKDVMKNGDINWPELEIIDSDDFFDIYYSQAQNSTAKLGLIFQLYMLNYFEKAEGKSKNWHQLPDPFFVTRATFQFYRNNFYLFIINSVINAWTTTGIMDKIIKDAMGEKMKFRVKKEPKVLTVENLDFGFFIWLGCCGCSFACFVLEAGYFLATMRYKVYRQNIRKPKVTLIKKSYQNYAKVHPILNEIEQSHQNIAKPKVHEQFRVRNKSGLKKSD
ncbi:hypothetical protein ACKWTF_015653 [Chironomus riparius]